MRRILICAALAAVLASAPIAAFAAPPFSVSNIPTGLAPLASPALTGTPTAPTPLASDNSTRLATTAWAKTTYAAFISYGVFGGFGGTVDTLISVNSGSIGKTILALCSSQNSVGNSTLAATYMLRFHFDGNVAPGATQIALDVGGSGLSGFTFGVSGSNTMTIVGQASSNWQCALQGNI